MPKPKQELTATATDMLPSEKAPLREWIGAVIKAWGLAIIQGEQREAAKRRDELEAGLRRWAEIAETDVTAAAEELANDFREQTGVIPEWGMPGRFVVTVEGVSADIHYGGLFDPKITARAIEWDQPFWTPWGSLELEPKSVSMQGANPAVWVRLLLTKAHQDFGETLCTIDRGDGPAAEDPAWQEGGYYDQATDGKYRGWKPGEAEAVEEGEEEGDGGSAGATAAKEDERPGAEFDPMPARKVSVETCAGDARDWLLDMLKTIRIKGRTVWNSMTQEQQQSAIHRADSFARTLLAQQADALVTAGYRTVKVRVGDAALKDQIEAKVTAEDNDDALLAIRHLRGQTAHLIIDPTPKMQGQRAPARAEPDQPDLVEAMQAEPAQAEAA